MIVYFDTVRRKRPVQEGGELIKLDWSSKKIIKKLPLFPTDPDIIEDPNPRGNSRGGKGIIINDAEIFVGTYHTILVFDHQLNLRRKITNNLFANIHEICFSGDDIWVSSTTIDCLILVDQRGNNIRSWWPREEKILQDRFELKPMEIDKKKDNRLRYLNEELERKESHTHLNSVAKIGKKVFTILNRLGVIVQVAPETKIIWQSRLVRDAHSLVVSETGDQLIFCGSFKKNIVIYDLIEGKMVKEINLLNFNEVAHLNQKYPEQPYSSSIFVRGLEILDSHRILVGISPASILELDYEKGKLLDYYQYSNSVGDAVHGLVHQENKCF